MSNQKRNKTFVFGNEMFGGSYTPGEFEIKFPEDMSREDFEKMFSQRMESLHKRGREFHEKYDHKSKKEKLKPLSIRVKPHTKEFFKNNSMLSPRDVLEMYEEFNNGSEAFINSLLEEEKQLEQELFKIQEKLHNARLFREKLSELEPEGEVLTDDDKLAKLQNMFEDTEIKTIGNETPIGKAKEDIVKDIQTYNTQDVCVYASEYLILTVYTNARPIAYYFKNEYSEDDVSEIVSHIEKYCGENDIGFRVIENSD